MKHPETAPNAPIHCAEPLGARPEDAPAVDALEAEVSCWTSADRRRRTRHAYQVARGGRVQWVPDVLDDRRVARLTRAELAAEGRP